MKQMKFPPQLVQALLKAENALVAIAVMYGIYSFKKAYQVGDKLVNTVTAPLGQAWSDVSAWAGGYQPVELTNLVIRRHYMDINYRLTDEAYSVLGRAHPSELAYYFQNRVLKAQYRHLIDQPINRG
jgi:hypothetical protein